MSTNVESIQKQVGSLLEVTPGSFENAVSALKGRLSKLSSDSNGGFTFEADSGPINLLEVIILREQAKAASSNGKPARAEQLGQLADFLLGQCVSTTYDYEAAIRFLTGLGLAEPMIREWSMPQPSLQACTNALKEHLKTDEPLVALQVGNCFGASLAWFSNLIVSAHPDSLMVSVDPNYSMGGVADNPQRIVMRLLSQFGLQKNNLMVTGYSLDKNQPHWQPSCEDLMPNLARLGVSKADFILLDGWHERNYTLREIRACIPLLREGGLILVDDVENIGEVREAIDEACADGRFVNLGMPERIAILAKS